VQVPAVPSELVENDAVIGYLRAALDACRDEERLNDHTPRIVAFHSFSISGILLDYEIVSIRPVETPVNDLSIPLGERTKPVRQMFEAVVRVVLCDRFYYQCSLDEIRQIRPGCREETITYECKEFEDGDWLFMDAELSR
jgi:hypothetical protein